MNQNNEALVQQIDALIHQYEHGVVAPVVSIQGLLIPIREALSHRPEGEAVAPYAWHVECHDPDYSRLCFEEEDAESHESDHAGEIIPVFTRPVSGAVAMPDDWRSSMSELVAAMRAYEMDADGPAPDRHRRIMARANSLLSAPPAAAEVVPIGEAVDITDDQCRDLWRLHGGSFHGPVVETGIMSEVTLLPLIRLLWSPVPPDTVPRSELDAMYQKGRDDMEADMLFAQEIATEAVGNERAELQAKAVPDGFTVQKVNDSGDEGFIIRGPIVGGVRANTSVWPDDEDSAHQMLFKMLAAAPAPAASPVVPEGLALLKEILAEADDYTNRTGIKVGGWPERARNFISNHDGSGSTPYTGFDADLISKMWSGESAPPVVILQSADLSGGAS